MRTPDHKVLLVDMEDRQIGVEDKVAAHMNGGKLHRAFSVFVFNSRGELMLQQRAASKYHSPSLWSNTCCSHPLDGEAVLDSAHRRLREEMGFDCELQEAFTVTYKVDVGSGLTEHEVDHVIFGIFDREPKINAEEVRGWCWSNLRDVLTDIEARPSIYSAWLKVVLNERLLGDAEHFLRHAKHK